MPVGSKPVCLSQPSENTITQLQSNNRRFTDSSDKFGESTQLILDETTQTHPRTESLNARISFIRKQQTALGWGGGVWCESKLKCLMCLFSNLKGSGASVQGQSRLLQEHRRNANAARLTSVLSPLSNIQGQCCINHRLHPSSFALTSL